MRDYKITLPVLVEFRTTVTAGSDDEAIALARSTLPQMPIGCSVLPDEVGVLMVAEADRREEN